MRNPDSIVVRTQEGRPAQLILLFHGVGASPAQLLPLAQRLGAEFPQATVVSVAAPSAASGGGFAWFPVEAIDEARRIERVAAAMPDFLAEIRAWQEATGVGPAETALVGFSQGAIMALEASLTEAPPASRVVAFGGRFARLPDSAPARTTVHLLHGKQDAVIPYRHTIEAAQHLLALGGDVIADVVPFVGHVVDPALVDLAVQRLKSHIPRHVWDEVQREEEAMRRPH